MDSSHCRQTYCLHVHSLFSVLGRDRCALSNQATSDSTSRQPSHYHPHRRRSIQPALHFLDEAVVGCHGWFFIHYYWFSFLASITIVDDDDDSLDDPAMAAIAIEATSLVFVVDAADTDDAIEWCCCCRRGWSSSIMPNLSSLALCCCYLNSAGIVVDSLYYQLSTVLDHDY